MSVLVPRMDFLFTFDTMHNLHRDIFNILECLVSYWSSLTIEWTKAMGMVGRTLAQVRNALLCGYNSSFLAIETNSELY